MMAADLVEVPLPIDASGGMAWLGVSPMFELLCVLVKPIKGQVQEAPAHVRKAGYGTLLVNFRRVRQTPRNIQTALPTRPCARIERARLCHSGPA